MELLHDIKATVQKGVRATKRASANSKKPLYILVGLFYAFVLVFAVSYVNHPNKSNPKQLSLSEQSASQGQDLKLVLLNDKSEAIAADTVGWDTNHAHVISGNIVNYITGTKLVINGKEQEIARTGDGSFSYVGDFKPGDNVLTFRAYNDKSEVTKSLTIKLPQLSPVEEAKTNFSASDAYNDIYTGMAEANAAHAISIDAQQCTESDTAGVGSLKICTYGYYGSSRGQLIVTYLNGVVYSKQKI